MAGDLADQGRNEPIQSVLIITRGVGIHGGYAGTQRVRCLALALTQSGVSTSVVCTQATLSPTESIAWEQSGTWRRVRFEYTGGSPVRSRSFIQRRLVAARGCLVGARRISQFGARDRSGCVYMYGMAQEFSFARWVYVATARLVGLPVVIELTEAPWTTSMAGMRPWRRLSPLIGARGAVAISEALAMWAENEFVRLGTMGQVLNVPILVEVPVRTGDSGSVAAHEALVAVSPTYVDAVVFAVKAIRDVLARFADSRLVVVGIAPDSQAARRIVRTAAAEGVAERVRIDGYVSRNELLRRYEKAGALLAPMLEREEVEWRFPSKIAEYLVSGRPVVSSSTGDAQRFLSDGQTAMLAMPGDAGGFAERLARLFEDPVLATRIGAAGRELALTSFDLRAHACRLGRFFADVIEGARRA